MHEWIIILALGVAASATAAVCVVCSCYHRMEREKNCHIVHAIREQERLARQLEHIRIEKETIECLLRSKLPPPGASNETTAHRNSECENTTQLKEKFKTCKL